MTQCVIFSSNAFSNSIKLIFSIEITFNPIKLNIIIRFEIMTTIVYFRDWLIDWCAMVNNSVFWPCNSTEKCCRKLWKMCQMSNMKWNNLLQLYSTLVSKGECTKKKMESVRSIKQLNCSYLSWNFKKKKTLVILSLERCKSRFRWLAFDFCLKHPIA